MNTHWLRFACSPRASLHCLAFLSSSDRGYVRRPLKTVPLADTLQWSGCAGPGCSASFNTVWLEPAQGLKAVACEKESSDRSIQPVGERLASLTGGLTNFLVI